MVAQGGCAPEQLDTPRPWVLNRPGVPGCPGACFVVALSGDSLLAWSSAVSDATRACSATPIAASTEGGWCNCATAKVSASRVASVGRVQPVPCLLSGPRGVLMRTGQHPQRPELLAVPRQGSLHLPVGPHQLGQVSASRGSDFVPGRAVPIAVTTHRPRVWAPSRAWQRAAPRPAARGGS